MAGAIQTPAVAAGPIPPAASTGVPDQGLIPFIRAAAPPRVQGSIVTPSTALANASTPIINVLPGTGFWLWEDLEVVVTVTGNTSANSVALNEDAPWNFFSSITVDDGGSQIINCDGFGLHLQNLYGGGWFMRDATLSSDTAIYNALSTGTGSAAGSGRFRLRVPGAINERNYLGMLGNQDRATKWQLRDDVAASSVPYSTAPAAGATWVINRYYGYLPVPSQVSADGRKQEQYPAWYGVLHYFTQIRSDAAPVGGSTVNHYIRNLSNAVRLFILVFRSNSSRSTAESNMPTQIDLVLGTDTVWSESYQERRWIMYSRYGFDAPNGVLVYDTLRDFSVLAGNELGDHYLYMGNLSEAQFRITYPTGMGSTNNSLTIYTDSLFIPPGVDLYGIAA